MRHTTRDGRDLHVHVDGPDDAPLTVVLAHCWSSDLTTWGYQALDVRGALGDQVRVLRHDSEKLSATILELLRRT